jgi:hypothetical protein
MNKVLGFLFPIALVYMLVLVVNMAYYGRYVSYKTEEKYLRNIHRYEKIDGLLFIYSDTLATFAKTAFNAVDPFSKWYLLTNDKARVRPDSKLSKSLDSLWNTNGRRGSDRYK